MPCHVKGQAGPFFPGVFAKRQKGQAEGSFPWDFASEAIFRKPFVKRLTAKGQGMAIDFLFAVLIFLLLLNAALSLWSSNSKSFEKEALLSDLGSRASQTIDLLVRDSGTPNDWETRTIDNTQIIGLASTDRVLDSEKVAKFTEWTKNGDGFWGEDYNKVRQKMLLASDFYFRLSDADGIPIAQTAVPPLELQDKWWVINVKRIVKYGGDAAIAEISLYHPKYP